MTVIEKGTLCVSFFMTVEGVIFMENAAGSGVENAVSICNRALCLVGGTRMISSLLEASTEAALCSSVYGAALRSMLAEHPWLWCRAAEALPPEAEVKVPGFKYAYGFPANCLYLHRVFNEETESGLFRQFTVSGKRMIFTDLYQAYAEYTKLPAEDIFPPLFAEALAWRIAMELSVALSGGDVNKREHLANFYREAVGNAAAADANESMEAARVWGDEYLKARS